MNKTSNYVNSKFKLNVDIHSLQNYLKVKCSIHFKDSIMIIKLLDNDKLPNKLLRKDVIKSLLSPIYMKEDDIYINYGLVRNMNCSDFAIKFEVFHPVYANPIVMTIYDITQSFLLSSKRLAKEIVADLFSFLKMKKLVCGKQLIETLVLFFNSLKEGLEQENIMSSLEDKVYRSLNDSKKYYDSTLSDLRKAERLRQSMKKHIYDKSVSKTSVNKRPDILGFPQETMGKYGSHYDLIDSILPDGARNDYKSFDHIFKEIKNKCLIYLEASVVLLFRVLGMDNVNMDLKKVKKYTVSQQLKSYKEKDLISNYGAENKSYKNLNMSYQHADSKRSKESFNNDALSRSMEDHKIIKSHYDTSSYGMNMIQKQNEKFSIKEGSTYHTNSTNKFNSNFIMDSREEGKFQTNEKKDPGHIQGNVVLVTLDENKENNFEHLLKGQHLPQPHDKNFINNLHMETPKFNKPKAPKSVSSKMSSTSQNSINNLNFISKSIEEMRKIHLFLPPTDYHSVLHNCVEISHRKFFEICFEDYFPYMFLVEKDKYDILKMDCILSFYFYLKGLKSFLFTDENKLFYANLFFYEE